MRIFRHPIIAEPQRVKAYTKAAIALYNYLQMTESSKYCPPGFVDGEDSARYVVEGTWKDEDSSALTTVSQVSSNRYVKWSGLSTMALFKVIILTIF